PGVTTVALPPAPPPAPEVRPAAQMFAQAMFAAAPIRADRDDRRGDSPATTLFPSVSVAAQGGFSAMAVPATVAAQSGTLDMARGEWMTSMIDRIETLRDESGAIGETRLKLAPDALGAVDISVRRDEAGQYQVRIAADTAQARTLLAEAAPRLADMAEARGLKLSHAGVDSGTGANPGFTDSHRRDGQHAPAAPRRPVSAAANDTSAATGTNSDTRIA
ncbi:MAG: flagellar hook-length control protein FliK, partial [Sphingomonadales bacterium]|nr:flagellar hook-length control protein FliK [Sphingomonadales bacterium]